MKAQNRPVQAAVNQLKPVTLKWPIRRWVRIAHLWAGVGLGLWIVMLGLAGSALVYQHSLRQILERSYFLRDTINTNFDKVRSLEDGVLFEFGPSRQQDLTLRGQIRKWQPQLRMLFLTRIMLFKYRLQVTGLELPAAVRASQLEFDDWLAAILETMAERMEEGAPKEDHDYKDAFEHLEKVLDSYCTEASHQSIAIEMKTFLALSQTAESLVMSLAQEI